MALTIDLAVAKTHKFGTRDSGDSVELLERPGGGVSAVIVDGQGSGAGAKHLSLLVAGRTVSLLNEGVRDGAAARAAHDLLYALRGGRVSAALDIVSVDLASGTVVFTRNSEVAMLLRRDGTWTIVRESGGRIGIHRHSRPQVLEIPAEPGVLAILLTDGVATAGTRYGAPLDLVAEAERASADAAGAAMVSDRLLHAAVALDRGRPGDDMTVVALRLADGTSELPIRRMQVMVPFPA